MVWGCPARLHRLVWGFPAAAAWLAGDGHYGVCLRHRHPTQYCNSGPEAAQLWALYRSLAGLQLTGRGVCGHSPDAHPATAIRRGGRLDPQQRG